MMFRPRWPSAGPTGGDGLALPAGICSLIKPMIFFAMLKNLFGTRVRSVSSNAPSSSFDYRRSSTAITRTVSAKDGPRRLARSAKPDLQLFDLTEFQFDRRRTTENRHRYTDTRLFVVHFLDAAVEV